MEHIGATVKVAVEYQLEEYKQVLRDFIPLHYAAKGQQPNRYLPWNWHITEKVLFAMFIPLVFWLKKARVGTCEFTFSQAWISRASAAGTGARSWPEVKAVHHLSAAYLIELTAGGAMPIPYRVFTTEQRAVFEQLAARAGEGAA